MSAKSTCQNEDQFCCYRSISSGGIRVLWEITSACNLECDFCLVEKKGRSVTVERALQIADDLMDEGVEKFMISGGEPLVYRGIGQLLRHLVDRGVLVKLLTNGTVHDEEVYELIRSEPTIEVSLSLQSVKPEKADAIFRKPGSFAKIVAAIEMLPRERLNVITACGTMNIDEIEEVIDWVAERGIPCISVINVFKDPSSPARFLDDCRVYRLAPVQIAQIAQRVQRKREQYSGRLVIRTTQFHGGQGETCGAGRSVLYLDSSGCLLPCTLTDNREYRDNVAKMSIRQAVRYYRDALPELPPSSCAPILASEIKLQAASVD